MQLSEKHISDFQKLYKRRFGHDISKKEALEKGLMVLKMVKQISVFSLKEERSENGNVDFY